MCNCNRTWYWLLSLLPVFTLHAIAHAQQLPVTIYNEKQGIDNMNANSTFQDSRGWIWVSTGSGIYRYEGNNFRSFPPPAGYTYRYVYGFVEVDGAIWCIDNQERIFVIRDQQVKLLEVEGLPLRFRSMIALDSGTYAYLSADGIYLYQHRQFYPVYREETRYPGTDNSEMPMVHVQDSLLLYKKKDGHLAIFNLRQHRQIILSDKIRAIDRDRTGNYWVLMDDCRLLQLDHIDWGNKIVHLLPPMERYNHLPHCDYVNFSWDDQDNLWLLADNKGLVKADITGKTNLYSEIDGLPGIGHLSMSQDRENHLWVTASGSLIKIRLNDPVQQFTRQDGLLANEVWGIGALQDGNKAWICTLGIQQFEKDRWEVLKHPATDHEFTDIIQSGKKVYAYIPWNVYELILNKSQNEVVGLKKIISLSSYFNPSPYGITEIKMMGEDTMVLGTISGLHVYHQGKFYKLPGFLYGNEQHVSRVFIDRSGYIWAGMFGGGLYQCRLRREKDSLKVDELLYWKNTGPQSPEISWIRSLKEDDEGNIWVGTRFNGLFRLSRDASGKVKQIAHYDTRNGLSNNTVWNIAKDYLGRLWLSTNGGLDMLHKIGKGQWEIKPFGNRLNIKQCKGIAITNDSLIWIDNFPGVACINMNKIFTQTIPPFQIAITQCMIENQLDSTTNSDTKPRIFPSAQNDLNFELGVNTYTNENYTQYSFQLEGADKTWSAYGRNYRVNYSNLQPGAYTFRARAMNKDGQLSSNIAAYTFVIRAPFYQRWWFLAALLALAMLLIYGLYKYRMKQIHKRMIFELQLAESEMKALRVQMNPHFIFNCMTAIDTFILTNDRKNASRFLNKFSKLIRLVLENSQRPLIALEKEIDCLELYIQLEQIRFKGQFDYMIKVDPQFIGQEIKLPPLLFQPYIENAILHGLRHRPEGEGLLEFRLFPEGNTIIGIIRDNGIGREAAADITGKKYSQHASMGLKITDDRLKLLKQAGYFDAKVSIRDLVLPNGMPGGTEVIIELNYINRNNIYKSFFES